MNDVSLPVTTLLACAIAIVLLILSVKVVLRRRGQRIALGGGDDPVLQRRIRAQANLTEYAPIFVILIGLAEFQGGHRAILTVLALVFLAGRISHGYTFAFTEKNSAGAGRVFGMIATFSPLVFATLFCLGLTIF